MTEEQLVEKVARALCSHNLLNPDNFAQDKDAMYFWQFWTDEARDIIPVVIAAMKEAGWTGPETVEPEPAVKTLSGERMAAALNAVLNDPTRI